MATTISGTLGIDKVVQTTIDAGVASTLNVTGSAPMYACRAWVNFTGGTVINAAGNVTTITDNGVGLYTVNFTTAMPDAGYSVLTSLQSAQTGASRQELTFIRNGSILTTSVGIGAIAQDGSSEVLFDPTTVSVAIFR